VEDLGGIVVLLLIWLVGAFFDQKKKQERKRRQAAARKQPPVIVEPVSLEELEEPPRPARPPQPERAPLPDATQREGSRLEAVLRRLDPELAESMGKARREKRPRPPAPAKRRPVPAELDFMGKAEAAVARRLQVADARVGGRTEADHDRFHDAIRQPAIKAGHIARFPKARIREAIVWSEILGPPKAFTLDRE